MKPEVEKKIRNAVKEFTRHIEFYLDDNTNDISIVCNIQLTIIKPIESITIDLQIP